jgi:hypothetical protein
MKCQALVSELGKLHVAIVSADDETERRKLNIVAHAIEKSIEIAIGTPEQRALEAAQSVLEGALAQALADSAKYGAEGAQVWFDRLQGLKLPGKQPSPYTSEAEEKLARVRAALTLPIIETARLVEIHKILGDA